MMMNRRRFLFLGAGVLASGAVDPLSLIQRPPPYGSTEWALSEDLGPSIVFSFRDDLTPALERLARQLKRVGEDLDRGLSTIIIPTMLEPPAWALNRCFEEFRCLPRTALEAATAIEGMKRPLEQLDRIARRVS